MDLYKRFKKLNLETSIIGLDQRNSNNNNTNYFCTPVGAQIIGLEGCDGIHYCFIKDFGEMVFAVNPMTCCDYHVYPLAKNFEDFLRLLVSVHSTTILEQIILLTNETFEKTMNSDEQIAFSTLPEVRQIIDTLQHSLNIKPIEKPFEYVKELQCRFDYSQIPFSQEYYSQI